MTLAANLYSEIFEITRADLENTSFTLVNPADYLSGMAAIRVTRLSQFWKKGDKEEPTVLRQSAVDLVAGLFGLSCPWVYLIRGLRNELQCWFATNPQAVDRESLASLLRSSFTDPQMAAEEIDLRSVEPLRCAVMLTGTPSVTSAMGDKNDSGQLEKLCRSLMGSNWLYLAYASPTESVATIQNINQISEKIKDARANYLLKASPIDEENRTAQRYIELLESKLKRYERGRTSGMWDVRCTLYTDEPALLGRARHSLQAAFSGDDSLPDPIRVRPCSMQRVGAPRLEPLTSIELAALARPLMEDFPGYELIDYARFGVQSGRIPTGTMVNVGEIVDRGMTTGNTLSLPQESLTKHGLVVGITGSGKTNSCFCLLDQLWNNGDGIPFLVVESAKSEYRALLGSPRFRGLRVFTVGDETLSPLRLNPFEVPPNILVQTHIDYIKSLFSAAFVLYPPMPYVLEQSIQEIYEDRGWDIVRNTNPRGIDSDRRQPRLSDLSAKIPVVVDRMGYEKRLTMDVKAGLLARINQLRLGGGKGLMLGARRSISPEVLFESPCLLELKQIVSDDEKAFIIGLILIRLYEYHEARKGYSGGLVHVTLIEEAHRLLRNVSGEQTSDVSANPKGRAIEVFTNILSEIRAYGEGILVAEQIPIKLSPDVVKNTGFKLIHRLVSQDDRELVGKATNLNEDQIRYLATLKTGEAVAWTEHTQKAVLVRVPLSPAKEGLKADEDHLHAESRALQAGDPSLFLPYPACESCPASSSRACATRLQDNIDEPLLDSFRRLFNAMRFNAAAVIPAFVEFRQLTNRSTFLSSPVQPYCAFVGIAENDIERRGEFRSWPYADVQFVMALACKLILRMVTSTPVEVATMLPEDTREAISLLQTRCKQLDEVEKLPFPCCTLCESPCQFRWDMAQADTAYGNEFRNAFKDENSKVERLVNIARHAAAKSFVNSDRELIAGASFCFALQQLAKSEMVLSMYFQKESAEMLKSHIAGRR